MEDDTQIHEAMRVAQALADEVRTHLLRAFDGARDATLKGDGTLVTQADLEADRLITQRLRERFPEHEILSEERKTFYEGAPWCWVIDPLDGTTNFSHGVPVWAVSIALLKDGRPVVGVVDVPPLGVRFHAVKGKGAFANGQRIYTRRRSIDWHDRERLQNELFVACSHTVAGYELPPPLRVRALGAAAFNFSLVARGAVLAAMEATPKVWDIAAAWLLIEEAGGTVHHLEGEPLLPLTPGRDYARMMPAHLAAASTALAYEFRHRIRKKRVPRENETV